MKSINFFAQLLAFTVLSAATASEAPWGFPLDLKFVVISLNGQQFGAKSPTLTITRDPKEEKFSGVGGTGCNSWRGDIKLSQNSFRVDELRSTLVLCQDEIIKIESNFLEALKAVKQWRMEGSLLILEGELETLTLGSAITPQ